MAVFQSFQKENMYSQKDIFKNKQQMKILNVKPNLFLVENILAKLFFKNVNIFC